jgi:hypothetical protein
VLIVSVAVTDATAAKINEATVDLITILSSGWRSVDPHHGDRLANVDIILELRPTS